MACFIVPAAEAVVTTIVTQEMKSKEKFNEKDASAMKSNTGAEVARASTESPFLRKLKWLNYMLWGGSFLLAFEHVWHGEITPWFPFITAAGNPADAAEMLHEMATSGVMMAVVVTVIWAGMALVTTALEKRAVPEESVAN
jgi:hypothetical protein